MKQVCMIVAIMLLFVVPIASADQAIVEDFESLSIGLIDAQGNWTSAISSRPDSIADVVSSPTHSGSRALHLTGFVSTAIYTISSPSPTYTTISFWYREQYGFGTNDTGNNMSLRNTITLSDGYNQHQTYVNICHAGTGHRSVLMTDDPIGNGSCVGGVGDITEGNWHYIEVEYDFVNHVAHARVDGGDWGSSISLRRYGGASGNYITSFAPMSIWDNPPQFWFDDIALTGGSGKLEVSPPSHDFGNQTVGSCSATPTVFTLSNKGNTNINVTNIDTNLTVSNNKVFEVLYDWGTNPCNQSNPTITPGDNCTVGVAFCPAVSGPANDNLVVTSNDPNSPAKIQMTGNGIGSSTDPNKIVAAALSMEGQLSGQSSLYPGGWLTDVYNGDGQRMRNAIIIYDKWKRNDPAYVKYNEKKINKMMIDAFSGSNYKPVQIKQLVDRIIEIYDGGNTSVPLDDESTLKYLGIQKQCLEWVMSIVNNAGGKAKNYQQAVPGGGVARKDVRPGMGYYVYRLNAAGKPDGGHAMIIVDTQYDKKGNLSKLKVAESNWGKGWQNPAGEIPWKRIVDTTRWIPYAWTYDVYKKFVVVDYGK